MRSSISNPIATCQSNDRFMPFEALSWVAFDFVSNSKSLDVFSFSDPNICHAIRYVHGFHPQIYLPRIICKQLNSNIFTVHLFGIFFKRFLPMRNASNAAHICSMLLLCLFFILINSKCSSSIQPPVCPLCSFRYRSKRRTSSQSLLSIGADCARRIPEERIWKKNDVSIDKKCNINNSSHTNRIDPVFDCWRLLHQIQIVHQR